jgi:uncharacterized protein (TIGR00730 family)
MFQNFARAAEGAPTIYQEHLTQSAPKLQNICVYCGSRPGVDPAFAAAGDVLGTELARAGLGLVYGGGGGAGIMGIIARATLAAGGRVTGIIPKFLKAREEMLVGTHDLIEVEDMHERKRIMFERSDAFVALPGGIGTLEELAEQMTWAKLGQHRKPVLIADIGGFWQPLLDLLSHMDANGFLQADPNGGVIVARGVEEILPRLYAATSRSAPRNSAQRQMGSTWSVAAMIDENEEVGRHDVYQCGPAELLS